MPTARRIATPRNSAITATAIPADVSPVRNAGRTAWSVAQPRTHASATVSAPNSRLPRVESVKIHGSCRIATPSTRNPSRIVDRRSSASVSTSISAGAVGVVLTRTQLTCGIGIPSP